MPKSSQFENIERQHEPTAEDTILSGPTAENINKMQKFGSRFTSLAGKTTWKLLMIAGVLIAGAAALWGLNMFITQLAVAWKAVIMIFGG